MLINGAEGIVLRQRKISGGRRMIVIFTRRYGKITAGTSINEKGRSRSALALRPFTYSEYDLYRGRESYSINSASVKASYYAIGEDLGKFMAASSFINYLDKVLQEGEAMPGLFGLALDFLEAVSSCTGDPDTLLYAFISKSLGMLGVAPELRYCADCGKPYAEFRQNCFFSVNSGGIICEDCANRHKTEINPLIYRPRFDIVDVFRFFNSRPLSTFGRVSLKKDVSGLIRRILAEYTGLYLDADVLSSANETEAWNGY